MSDGPEGGGNCGQACTGNVLAIDSRRGYSTNSCRKEASRALDGHGFTASYSSVRRFLQRLGHSEPIPFRRLEVLPGEQAQVDFGTGAPILRPEGKRRRPHVIRVVLSYSRKGYSEVVYHQTTEEFLRCLENAFWSFGGVPQTTIIDNLKAAVAQADWYDPGVHPKIQSFCQHYGTVILPTKPRMPRHKGKVERGIGYVQSNALKGRTFTSLAEQNADAMQSGVFRGGGWFAPFS